MINESNTMKIVFHTISNIDNDNETIQPQIQEDLMNTLPLTQESQIISTSQLLIVDNMDFLLEYSLYDEFEDQNEPKETIKLQINSSTTEIMIRNQTQYRKVFVFTILDKKYSCLIFLNKICHLYFYTQINKTEENSLFNYHIYIKNWSQEMFNLVDVSLKSCTFLTSELSNDLRYFVVFNYNKQLSMKCELKQAIANNLKICYYYSKEQKCIDEAIHLMVPPIIQQSMEDSRIKAKETCGEMLNHIDYLKSINYKKNDLNESITFRIIKEKITELNSLIPKVKDLQYFQRSVTDIEPFEEEDYDLYCSFLICKIAKCLNNANLNSFLLFITRLSIFEEERAKITGKTLHDLQILCFKYRMIKTTIIDEGQKINEEDFEIIFPLEGIKDDAYDNYAFAKKFIQSIIDQMSENSKLFHCAQQMNSPISPNICYEKELNSFELHYLPLDEVKFHLRELLKLRIARYYYLGQENGFTDHIGNYICINEKILFGNLGIHNMRKYQVRLALIMVICHELFGHLKIRVNHKRNITPTKYFCIDVFNEYIEDNKGEAGRIFEHHISYNKHVIHYLKHCKDENCAQKLLDVNLWISDTFDKLRDIVPIEKLENEGNLKAIHYQTQSTDRSYEDIRPYSLYEDDAHFCN